MVEIVYYVATSLDGFIATLDGGIDWLPRLDPELEDFGYRAFYDSIDGLIMGRLTFDKIRRHAAWPYPKKPCWVFTHRPIESEPSEVIPTAQPLAQVIAEMESYKLRRIFLVGGGRLASQFQRQGLIAEYNIGLVPVLLGTGMPLFAGPGEFERLKLIDTRSFATGEVLMRYRRSALNPPRPKAIPPAITRHLRHQAEEAAPAREPEPVEIGTRGTES
ncbi:MAG TPA: dihydrofolate reductase family protein [Hypericibacter adhaerens]|jgi:dihydrofolate reductase|uniref:dihydrofolate reductase family protein n=1 Tax=Hypericibacter adhaerens TaxID=2602016 RepID=UPI002C088400|nr:dihydrofolate reductase family protein [Hypericibacter adhaerens]HWA43790.1 dihydrofolate reductase family protein [Hypericibacter adhaerens]